MDTIRTSAKFKHYDGLYGDIDHKPQAEYIFLEQIETRSKEFGWMVDPHIHSHLYQLFFIESGKVKFQSSSQSTNLPIPCVIFIPPNTLHGLHYSANVKGQILTLSDNVIDSLFTSHSAVMLSIENLHLISFSDKNSVSFSAILKLVKQIHEELFSECFEKRLMLESFFRQLIIYVCSLTKIPWSTSLSRN